MGEILLAMSMTATILTINILFCVLIVFILKFSTGSWFFFTYHLCSDEAETSSLHENQVTTSNVKGKTSKPLTTEILFTDPQGQGQVLSTTSLGVANPWLGLALRGTVSNHCNSPQLMDNVRRTTLHDDSQLAEPFAEIGTALLINLTSVQNKKASIRGRTVRRQFQAGLGADVGL